MDMDCKKNVEEVKIEFFYFLIVGLLIRLLFEGVFILGWKLLLLKCEIWLEINLYVYEEIFKFLGYYEI